MISLQQNDILQRNNNNKKIHPKPSITWYDPVTHSWHREESDNLGKGFRLCFTSDSETPVWIPSHHLKPYHEQTPTEEMLQWDVETPVMSLKSMSLKQTKITIALLSTHQNKIPTWGQIKR